MIQMKEIHPIQLRILKKLLFVRKARYTEIKPDPEMENNKFSFHLNKLLKLKFIQKIEEMYFLTETGKGYSNRMHTQTVKMKRQPKITTIFCCVNKKKRQKEYLLHTRKKNPFFNCQGFATTKVWFGEKVKDAAERGLYEETNLKGKGELFAIRHYHVFSNDDVLVEDKMMYAFRFENPEGKLISKKDGEFYWVKENEILNVVRNPLEEFREIYKLLLNYDGKISFDEVDLYSKKF
jgi:ADP-ribose pyrophosphatase YjhB (NUDIX family)